MDEKLYYLQDSRSYVGNDMQWWKLGGGYTTDISKAEIFTEKDAIIQHQCRESDIPWPKKYIDQRTRPVVDVQYTNIKDALYNTGIKLIKRKIKKDVYRCNRCNVFMTIDQYYSAPCKRCGTDNRP